MIISGIWHGAGYNFIIWGLLHALFIFSEKILDIRFLKKRFQIIKIIYSYLVVTFLWLFFRVNEISDIKFFFTNFSSYNFFNFSVLYFILFIFALNYFQKYITLESLNNFFKKINKIFITSMSFILITVCIVLAKGSSQKFIYFNF